MRDLIAVPVALASVLLTLGTMAVGAFSFATRHYLIGGVCLFLALPAAIFLQERLLTGLQKWRAHEKLTPNRKFLERFVGLPLFTFAGLALIYPGGPLLGQMTGAGDAMAYCTTFSPKAVGLVMLLEVTVLIGWSIFFRLRNDGVLALIESVPVGLLLATWFIAGGLGIALCRPLPALGLIYSLSHAFLLAAAIYCVSWLHVHLPRTIDFNPNVYDFERGQLALFGHVARPDGEVVRPVHFLYVLAFFAAAKLSLDYFLGLVVTRRYIGDWEAVICMTAIGYLFVILAASGVSTAWHVARRMHGQKMVIKEFSVRAGGSAVRLH